MNPLRFELPTPLRAVISKAIEKHSSIVALTDLSVLTFKDFGKDRIKGHGMRCEEDEQRAFRDADSHLARTLSVRWPRRLPR